MGTEQMAARKGSIIRRESSGKKFIDQSRIRLFCITAFFFLSFSAICIRLVEITVCHHHSDEAVQASIPAAKTDEQLLEEFSAPLTLARSDIVDRNGLVLATTLSTESLFANPGDLADPELTAQRLAGIFPEINEKDLAKKLNKDASFVWIKRNLTPKEQRAANNLGIPGLYFQPEQKRVYPHGNLLSHVIGYVGLDNGGLGGIEKSYDGWLRDTKNQKGPLALSIDLRIQNIVREQIKQGMEASSAIGATGIVMDLHTGEILALTNLPDFDPDQPGVGPITARFDRASLGTYEMGSTFKTFTMAAALDYGIANLSDSTFDATHPLQYGGFTIHDDHPLNRWATIPEIYAYSSNIGTARVAMEIGPDRQQAFLRKLGLMEPVKIELPELGAPRYPADWKEINTITIAYGHGMAVTPLHLVRAFAAMVNGGVLTPLTLIKGGNDNKPEAAHVISEKTSRMMRRLTRMVDEPKCTKATFDFATGGWIAAPIVGNIISQIAPLLDIRPVYEVKEDSVNQSWVDNANQRFMHAVSY